MEDCINFGSIGLKIGPEEKEEKNEIDKLLIQIANVVLELEDYLSKNKNTYEYNFILRKLLKNIEDIFLEIIAYFEKITNLNIKITHFLNNYLSIYASSAYIIKNNFEVRNSSEGIVFLSKLLIFFKKIILFIDNFSYDMVIFLDELLEFEPFKRVEEVFELLVSGKYKDYIQQEKNKYKK